MPVELAYAPSQSNIIIFAAALIITALTIIVIISFVLYKKYNRQYLDPMDPAVIAFIGILIAFIGVFVIIYASVFINQSAVNDPTSQLEIIKQKFPAWESLDQNDYRIPDTLLQRQRNHVGAVGSDVCVARVDTVQNNIQVLCEPMVIDD